MQTFDNYAAFIAGAAGGRYDTAIEAQRRAQRQRRRGEGAGEVLVSLAQLQRRAQAL
eukprot:SAG31_NODE_34222_length_335_cov_0.872881_1_plen_56_part_01